MEEPNILLVKNMELILEAASPEAKTALGDALAKTIVDWLNNNDNRYMVRNTIQSVMKDFIEDEVILKKETILKHVKLEVDDQWKESVKNVVHKIINETLGTLHDSLKKELKRRMGHA